MTHQLAEPWNPYQPVHAPYCCGVQCGRNEYFDNTAPRNQWSKMAYWVCRVCGKPFTSDGSPWQPSRE